MCDHMDPCTADDDLQRFAAAYADGLGHAGIACEKRRQRKLPVAVADPAAALTAFGELTVAEKNARLLAKSGTTFAVDAVAVPAEYGAEGKGYDIALLHIAADDQTDRTVVMPAPATMVGTDVDIPADADVRLYGWGTTGIQDDTTKALDVKGHIAHTADYLQVGAEKAIPVAACKAVDQDLAAGMICTRSADPAAHTASCYGDSGGPLVTSDVDGDVLVGVVKGSMVGCGLPGIPDEFTAVSPYRDWIARAMGALKPATAPGVPADARIVRVPFAVPGAATAR